MNCAYFEYQNDAGVWRFRGSLWVWDINDLSFRYGRPKRLIFYDQIEWEYVWTYGIHIMFSSMLLAEKP